MASDLPIPKSFEQIQSDQLSAYAAKVGINDFNVGSAVTSFFEVVALTTARASGDIFQILRDFSVDRATGVALKRLALENNVTPITARPATGAVLITDSSFAKISTKIYAGAQSPNIGSTQIKVSDASLFNPTGSVYIGRNTPNVEGPLPYTSITLSGNFFIINLSSPTTKFHNIGETVIMAQGGNRTIPINAIVTSPSTGSSSDIRFSVTAAAIILDGETQVDNVPVVALTPGSFGNIPRGAIKQFASPPFIGATVTNSLPFTTGSDSETDDQLRIRIKRAQASTGLGTPLAVKSSVIGATPSDENATIVSDEIITTSTGAILYIDDGKGYEAKTAGVGIESIVDSALGGEQFFQLATGGRQAPVAKAFLESTVSAPFDLIEGDTLAITVGETTYEHTFLNTDFRSPGGATAFEVTASVNANTAIGFEATTSGGGKFVVFRSKTEGNDTLKTAIPTTGERDAAVQLNLPDNEVQTLRLYKNKLPLSKDGKTASIFTQAQSIWSATIAEGATLVLSVDGTSFITYTFLNADFIATGLYGSVSSTNSLESWVLVFNAKLTGITASIVGNQIKLVSNLGTSDRAQIIIDPSSTLIAAGMFDSSTGLSSQGKTSDFILSRNTAQFELTVPLVVKDDLTAGSDETEARTETIQIPSGSVVLSSDAHVWFLIDSPGAIVPTGIVANSTLTVSVVGGNYRIRYEAAPTNPNAFSLVLVGDYVVIWSDELLPTHRIEGRIRFVTPTFMDIQVTLAEGVAALPGEGPTAIIDGFIVLRSNNSPQKFRVTSGTKTLDQIAQELQSQSQSLIFSVKDEQSIVARTRTKNISGSLLVVTSDTQGKLLGFVSGDSDISKDSLIAFYDSEEADAQLPLFQHYTFATDQVANPIDSFITSFDSSVDFSTRDPNEMICMLHPYGIIATFTPTGNTTTGSNQLTSLSSTVGISIGFSIVGPGIAPNTTVRSISGSTITMSNNATATISTSTIAFNNPRRDSQPYGECIQETTLSGTTVGIAYPGYINSWSNTDVSRDIRRLRGPDAQGPVDRFFIASQLDFGAKDTAVVIVDNDIVSKSFEMPLYRRAITNTTFPNNAFSFNAYDVDSGTSANFVSAFGATFDFSNFKALMQAHKVLKPTPPKTAILYRSNNWGRSGEKINVGYIYPSVPNNPISSAIVSTSTVSVRISLKSGPGITTSIASNTTWNVTITPNTPSVGIDQVTYTYNSGTAPGLTLSGGEYVNISPQTSFSKANTGIFRVSTQAGFAPTATSFTVQRKNGSAVAELNKSTTVTNGIIFYSSSPTTALEIANYVNVSLLDYFSAILVNDGGTDGSGVILLSTEEDSAFTYDSIQLLDGINWIISNNLSGSPQFTFKRALALPSDVGYAFNDGEEVRLSPTTMDQVRRLESITAVTGFTTSGTLGIVDRGNRLEIATDILGSDGSIQIADGLGNTYSTPILDSGVRLDNTYLQVSVDRVSGQGIQSDQWFKLQALNAQRKNAFFSSNTSVRVFGNSPVLGQSTIKILGRQTSQRYFGKPRHHIRSKNVNFVDQRGFKIEKQGALVCLSWNSIGTSPHFIKTSLNFNDSGGGTVSITPVSGSSDSQYVILTGGVNFTELSMNDLITISGMTSSSNNGTFLVTGVSDDGKTIRVLNSNAAVAASDPFVSGNFSAHSSVSEGDTLIIPSASSDLNSPYYSGIFSSPFSILNQGKFRVIRRFNDSVWFENPNAIEEDIALLINPIDLGFTTSTSFKVWATNRPDGTANNSLYLNWNGTGTEPILGNAKVGDIVTFGSNFAVANRGDFMVVHSGAKLQEITELNMPAKAQFPAGPATGLYFDINTAGNVILYRIWFQTGTNVAPSAGGRTLASIDISNVLIVSAEQVAATTATAINGFSGLSAVAVGNKVTVSTVDSIETIDASAGTMPAPFTLSVTQQGRRAFLEVINPSAVNESSVLVTPTTNLQVHRPQMQFWEYEATVEGDEFVVTGDTLTVPNAGVYPVIRVLDRDTVLVSASLVSITNASLNGKETSVFVQEGVPYSGYKHVYLKSPQPGAPTRNYVVFDTTDQYDKINESGEVFATSLNKLDFNTAIRKGLDSYRFNIGLIAEANRIIYGDPRDSATYPGVGAAGAEIFVREPLIRRIQVAIDVRVSTGVPFAQTADQVRTSVSSLINSNDVGQPIAISAIVSVVNSIPGVRAVAISSPQYDSTHDTIFVAPSEKALILDPTLDISVIQISG